MGEGEADEPTAHIHIQGHCKGMLWGHRGDTQPSATNDHPVDNVQRAFCHVYDLEGNHFSRKERVTGSEEIATLEVPLPTVMNHRLLQAELYIINPVEKSIGTKAFQ
jgi:hypothetical protein